MAKKPEPVKVKVIEISGAEFKPGSTYLLAFNHHAVAFEDMQYVVEDLQEQSGCMITAVGCEGDPREAVTLFAIPERNENVIVPLPPGHDPDAPGALVGKSS